jgi:outer membrane protein OmpA-like peptidoglycan-associated protein
VTDAEELFYSAVTETPATIRFVRRQEQVAQKMGYKVMEKYALILFDFDKADIKARNRVVVDRIISRLGEIPDADVTIVGHTDTIGSEQYNLKLSERRAKAVYDQMIAAGMTPGEKIVHQGVGPSFPLYDNSLPEGRALNRTVTVSLAYEQKE